MTRTGLLRFARFMIGTLIFAQLAVAAHACAKMLPTGDTSAVVLAADQPAQTATAPAAAPTDVVAPGCAGMVMDNPDAVSGALCAAHCQYGQQSDQASTLSVPAALLIALYVTPALPGPALPPRSAAGSMSALVAASPPHTILHCVFRI